MAIFRGQIIVVKPERPSRRTRFKKRRLWRQGYQDNVQTQDSYSLIRVPGVKEGSAEFKIKNARRTSFPEYKHRATSSFKMWRIFLLSNVQTVGPAQTMSSRVSSKPSCSMTALSVLFWPVSWENGSKMNCATLARRDVLWDVPTRQGVVQMLQVGLKSNVSKNCDRRKPCEVSGYDFPRIY